MKRLLLLVTLYSISSLPLNAASWYVRSTSAGLGDGTTWANAYTTLAAALNAKAAGDTFWVSQAHAETQASTMTLTSPGTAASPVTILCVNDAAAPPTALATTATVTNTGAFSMNFNGFAYVYGITFTCATGNNSNGINFASTTPWWWKFESCSLKLSTTSSGGAAGIIVGAQAVGTRDDNLLELHNTTVSFANVSQEFQLSSNLRWTGTSSALILGSVPTYLFADVTGSGPRVFVEGVDLSGETSNLFNVGGSQCQFIALNCKLGVGVSIIGATGSTGQGGEEVIVINSDSANTNTQYYRHVYQGAISQETTIVRTGGASDGTTTVSRKMVSSANSKYVSPLATNAIEFWNDSTSSVTVTIPVVTDNVTLTNGDAWLEVEHLGTSGFPLGVFATGRGGDTLTPGTTNWATDSTSTWTTTGLTTPVKQSLSQSFTPQIKGLVRVRVMLAKASATLYFDPKALSTSGRQYPTIMGYSNEGASTSATSRVWAQ